jgi:mannose-6-phosphate isomerase
MYKFAPILKTLVWGTEKWVLSSVKGSESVVAEGPDKGKTLNEVYGGEFPLLIKFIDSRTDLSIQVHPNDELAAKRHGCHGKTEMWYVAAADEGAHLLSGLKKSITPQEYVSLVEQNKIVDVLADYPVNQGDVFFLPAGRIHAIGGGCHIVEIQQTSDITYRIYDYGRMGMDGKPRQLHTELAKDAIDYSVLPDYRTHYEKKDDTLTQLVKCPYFTTSLLTLTAPYSLKAEGKSTVIICFGGKSKVASGAESYDIAEGEVILAGEGDFSITPLGGDCKLIVTRP